MKFLNFYINKMKIILLAGGKSTRFGENKYLFPIKELNDDTLLDSSICLYQEVAEDLGAELIVVGTEEIVNEFAYWYEDIKFVVGGRTKNESIKIAYEHIGPFDSFFIVNPDDMLVDKGRNELLNAMQLAVAKTRLGNKREVVLIGKEVDLPVTVITDDLIFKRAFVHVGISYFTSTRLPIFDDLKGNFEDYFESLRRGGLLGAVEYHGEWYPINTKADLEVFVNNNK